ncbi:hypothetical protein [Paracoccus beibuensis]|uniref:hypothetical protein n=1 Tax=Paracoccus beibuensis TaxID=547602 RepID=UPI00223F5068|nr:hypothetical protein [Paracoccus beibuensis]
MTELKTGIKVSVIYQWQRRPCCALVERRQLAGFMKEICSRSRRHENKSAHCALSTGENLPFT